MVSRFFIVCLVTLLAGTTAFGYTIATWTFSTPDTSPAPDSFVSPGTPLLKVSTCYWIDNFDDWHQGVFPLSGQIDVYLPNSQVTGPGTYKEIELTLTWRPSTVDTILSDVPGVAVTPFDYMDMSQIDYDAGQGWIRSIYDITIWPNPTEEWFYIKGDILVDELVIETWCIPEPMTVTLLGLGGLALMRRRRV